MNGTTLRTILAVATSLNTALMATDITGFDSPTIDAVYKVASIVLNFIIVAIATYYNNDYTEIAKEKTTEMRLLKNKEELDYGFFEDEDEEGEGLDEDEENTEELDDGVNDEIPEDGEADE